MSKDEKGEEKIDSMYEDEGAGGSYTLFPKVECPDIFEKDSVYHQTTDLKNSRQDDGIRRSTREPWKSRSGC